MRPAVAFQSTPVLLDRPDREGQLVFADGQLVALLVRLDGDAHPKTWLEHGFSKPVWTVGAVGLSSVSELGRSQRVASTPTESVTHFA